jgi:hypothetical protein
MADNREPSTPFGGVYFYILMGRVYVGPLSVNDIP